MSIRKCDQCKEREGIVYAQINFENQLICAHCARLLQQAKSFFTKQTAETKLEAPTRSWTHQTFDCNGERQVSIQEETVDTTTVQPQIVYTPGDVLPNRLHGPPSPPPKRATARDLQSKFSKETRP